MFILFDINKIEDFEFEFFLFSYMLIFLNFWKIIRLNRAKGNF